MTLKSFLLRFRQLVLFLLTSLAVLVCAAAPAAAEQIIVLSSDGRVQRVQDRIGTLAQSPAAAADVTELAPFGSRPSPPSRPSRPSAPTPARARSAQTRVTVGTELARLLEEGRITLEEHDERLAALKDARALTRRLQGRRKLEMAAVVALIDRMAAERRLTHSRLEPLWLILEGNREWWTTGPLLSPRQRVQFAGSELIWQYMPGSGLQLHPLANFGRLNGFWMGGRRYRTQMEALLDELLPLAVERGGGVAWEYYFTFGPARAPWVSGMAQATALQALARSSTRLGRAEEVLPLATRGLEIFEQPPPVGVRVSSGEGAHYLLYSGDPQLRVLNGFMQSLVGLHDFATFSGDPRAVDLFDDGDRAAESEITLADTGAWSLYSLGRVSQEATLEYHKLVVGFLDKLCTRTSEPYYCDGEARFASYLTQPPTMTIKKPRLRSGHPTRLFFDLSKMSHVDVEIRRGSRVVMKRSLGTLRRGPHFSPFTPPRSRRALSYDIAYGAVDLAGNRGVAEATVHAKPLPPRRKPPAGRRKPPAEVKRAR